MNRPLLKKYLNESWMLFIAIAIGLFAFGWFRVTVVCELDTGKFRQIIDLLPSDWRKFASVDFDWLVSYLGRTSTGFEEPMLIFLMAAWSMVRGSDVVSGELSRGTMEMLLAQPVCRREIYLRHAKYTVIGLLLLSLVLWLGMASGVWTATVEETTYPSLRIPVIDYKIPLQFLKPNVEVHGLADFVNPLMYLPGILNLFSVAVFFAGFAAMCSAFDRYRWRTVGVLAVFFFSNASMKVVGKGSDRFSWMENACVFGLYHPAGAIERYQAVPMSVFWLFRYRPDGSIASLGLLPNCLLPLLLAAIMYWIGLRYFEERDLPAAL
ncbi:ABC transporter permease [Mariniblastus sp.]|nr:ABC transporter permease [Mariniblastus sp.]MDB2687017.1 ABC transporter permease [Mariniblastus sp.]